MSFNTYLFILVFCPVVILLYFLANKFSYKAGKIALIVSSLFFVGYSGVYHAVMLLISIAANYFINHFINRSHKKSWLYLGIVFNVLYLGVFKYGNFFAGNVDIIMPIGVSFYTFQAIAYCVDNYRGEIADSNDIINYCLFMTYFPKILQGPIPYYSELGSQFDDANKKKFSFDNLSKGLFLFTIGLAKKVLIADSFAIIADYGYQNISGLNSLEAVLSVVGYTLQLYFDFSGYCDMAMGVSTMLNIDLPVNFDSPYKSLNISDFWKRWHITLTRFLTKYIYIPLGGNRKGTIRTYVNILIIFLISGLWHGVGTTFIIWGAMHGVLMVVYRLTKNFYRKIPSFLQWCLNFVIINITWVFFRASTVNDALRILNKVVTGGMNFSINAELTESLLQPTLINVFSQFITLKVVVIVGFVIAIISCALHKNSIEMANRFKPTMLNWIFVFALMMLSITSISGVSSFLYVNF